MCMPAPALGLLVGAIGVGTQAYAAHQETKAQNRANEYNAQMLERNATISRQQAQDAQVRGDEEELRLRQRVGQLKGTQRSALAASGVQVDTGSAYDLLQDTTRAGELDALSSNTMPAWRPGVTRCRHPTTQGRPVYHGHRSDPRGPPQARPYSRVAVSLRVLIFGPGHRGK